MPADQANNNQEPEDIVDLSTPEEEHLEYEPFSEEIDPSSATHPKSNHNESNPSEDQVQIQILQEQLDRTKDQLIRALAEAENTRKRAQKDREDASRFAISSFSKDLISVADNLRRALDAMPEGTEDQNLKNLIGGIEATERELLKSFEKNGIQKTNPIDQPFDPNFHEVMFEAPMPDKKNGSIIQVIEPGYVINGRILRPARVGVAKNAEGSAPETPSEPGQTINTEA